MDCVSPVGPGSQEASTAAPPPKGRDRRWGRHQGRFLPVRLQGRPGGNTHNAPLLIPSPWVVRLTDERMTGWGTGQAAFLTFYFPWPTYRFIKERNEFKSAVLNLNLHIFSRTSEPDLGRENCVLMFSFKKKAFNF